MPRVAIADPLAADGLALLEEGGVEVVDASGLGREDLLGRLAGADALLVRSRTRVDRELLDAAPALKVVGRAGIGVDNIDLESATERGILVFNVPTANLLSATEHTFALLLALARRVAAADATMKAGEWNRKAFVGVELYGKRLGIVGLGRIGQQVARRARAFGMAVVAHDPFLDPAVAARLDLELLGLDELLEGVDAVTIHVPLTDGPDGTRHLLSGPQLARMREGALLVNCARGGVVDEAALLEALESGHIGGAALDVFEEEPPTDRRLVRHPRVVATPHLGAQTREAQDRASREAARMALAALGGSLAVSAVNLPFTWDGERDSGYLVLAEQLGRLASAIVGGGVRRIAVDLWGLEDELARPVSLGAARGALTASLGRSVGFVNVERVAAERGVELVRRTRSGPGDYPTAIGVSLADGASEIELAGTLLDGRRPRVVRFGSIPLEFSPEGPLLILRSYDRPGVVGTVGNLLGEAGVNIADVHLARKDGEEDAWTVLRLDQDPEPALLDRLAALPAVRTVRRVDLGRPWAAG
jgi:D-3-phosphoglycerate dehydrogenase